MAANSIESAFLAGACAQLQELASELPGFLHVEFSRTTVFDTSIHGHIYVADARGEPTDLFLALMDGLLDKKSSAPRGPTVSPKRKQTLASKKRSLACLQKVSELFDTLLTNAPRTMERVFQQSPCAAHTRAVQTVVLAGPDAGSFARQMGETQTAALIEARQLDSSAHASTKKSAKKTL
jgi:hypothetical protein